MLTEKEVKLVKDVESQLKEVEGDYGKHADLGIWALDKFIPILKRHFPKKFRDESERKKERV